MALPGDDACAPVGPPCPDDGFPPVSDAVFVRAGASGGDGSRAAPLGTIREALSLADDGGTIAIAPGEYAGELVLQRDVTLRGACRDVVLTGAVSVDTGTINVETAHASIEDLTIRPAGQSALVALGAVELTLARVVIEGASEVAIAIDSGARILAQDLAIHDLRTPLPYAVVASGASRFDAERIYIRGAAGRVFWANDAEIALRQAVVTEVRQDDGQGFVISAFDGAMVTLDDVVFGNAHGSSIVALGAGASVIGTRVDARDVEVTSSTTATRRGGLVLAGESARVELTELRCAAPRGEPCKRTPGRSSAPA